MKQPMSIYAIPGCNNAKDQMSKQKNIFYRTRLFTKGLVESMHVKFLRPKSKKSVSMSKIMIKADNITYEPPFFERKENLGFC